MLVGLKYGTPDDSAPGASTCFHAESRIATEAHYTLYFGRARVCEVAVEGRPAFSRGFAGFSAKLC